MACRLRPAVMEDWAKLYAWRNDPLTLEYFAGGQKIPLREHLEWLQDVIFAPKTRVFIAVDQESNDGEVGTGRLDISTQAVAHVSFTVAPERRGRGHGTNIIEQLIVEARKEHLRRLVAEVKAHNYASLRVFAHWGFSIKKISEENYVILELKL